MVCRRSFFSGFQRIFKERNLLLHPHLVVWLLVFLLFIFFLQNKTNSQSKSWSVSSSITPDFRGVIDAILLTQIKTSFLPMSHFLKVPPLLLYKSSLCSWCLTTSLISPSPTFSIYKCLASAPPGLYSHPRIDTRYFVDYLGCSRPVQLPFYLWLMIYLLSSGRYSFHS